MFTGIIEAIGEVQQKTALGLVLSRPKNFDDLKLGSSVSVSGVCLSVTKLTSSSMSFSVVSETWKRTSFKNLKKGDQVNLERSVSQRGRFEGHFVQGHTEDTARVASITKEKKQTTLVLKIPKHLINAIIPKGSIAVDGVSLTVASIKGSRCTIALIPHTLSHTTLGLLKKGDVVNIETDMMIRAFLWNQKTKSRRIKPLKR
mgnify:CR=1 FL=1